MLTFNMCVYNDNIYSEASQVDLLLLLLTNHGCDLRELELELGNLVSVLSCTMFQISLHIEGLTFYLALVKYFLFTLTEPLLLALLIHICCNISDCTPWSIKGA